MTEDIRSKKKKRLQRGEEEGRKPIRIWEKGEEEA